MADLSTPLLDMVNTKLTETGTDCSDPHGPKLAPMTLPKPAAGPGELSITFLTMKYLCSICLRNSV